MEQVGMRELRGRLASALRRAEAGERLVITVNGRPAAVLGPLAGSAGAPTIDGLVAQGLVIRARRGDRPAPAVRIPLWAGASLDRALAEVR